MEHFKYFTNIADITGVTLKGKAEVKQLIKVDKTNYEITKVEDSSIIVIPYSMSSNKGDKAVTINQVIYPRKIKIHQ